MRAGVKVIRETIETDCVWLLGHSEGGLLAFATVREDDAVCGLILVATPGRPLGEVLKIDSEPVQPKPGFCHELTRQSRPSRLADGLMKPICPRRWRSCLPPLFKAFSPARSASIQSGWLSVLQADRDRSGRCRPSSRYPGRRDFGGSRAIGGSRSATEHQPCSQSCSVERRGR